MSSLQDLVDALAAELGRPVGIDDRHFRALAYSSHDEGVDQVRRDSILRREAPQEVTGWLLSLGISERGGHVRVPANPEFGMDARLCLPLRFDGILLGYLWLIDEPSLQDSGVLDLTERYGEQLAAEMVRVSRLESADRELQLRALGRLLFEPDPNGAAGELGARGVLTSARSFVALVAQAHTGASGPGPATSEHATEVPLHPGVRVHLSLAAEEVRRRISPNHALAIAHGSEVVVAVAFEDPGEPARRAAALLEACNGHLGRVELNRGEGVQLSVGVGSPRPHLDGLRASYREARIAADVAHRIPELGGGEPVAWEDLGAYRTLARLVADRDPGELLPAALPALLAERDGALLVETLETYLELGGDAKAASERLFLHRSSLYKRLHRVERLTGYELRRGDDRLELHMALRLWRLAGGASARQSSSGSS